MGSTEDEMVGWYHRFDGHEFEQAPGIGDGQGSLVCCGPWVHKESDTTEQLNLELRFRHHGIFWTQGWKLYLLQVSNSLSLSYWEFQTSRLEV